MRKVPPSLMAIVPVLTLWAGGCAFGPNSDTSLTAYGGRKADSKPELINPAKTLADGTHQRDIEEYLDRSVVLAGGSLENDEDSGAIQLTSGVFGESGAVKSISSTFKSGVDKVTKALTPTTPVKQAEDPISLSKKSKASPNLYAATALLSEQRGRDDEAEQHYQAALKIDPKHPGALLGYARFKDRRNDLHEATKLYQRAIEISPRDSAVFNDLGLCFARRGMYRESIAALERAIQLQPGRLLYRNNIAMVLVEIGRPDAAVAHLGVVQKEAVAYYNVGYILQKNGQSGEAAKMFAMSLQKDPSLVQARIWLSKLATETPPGNRGPQIASDAGVNGRPAERISRVRQLPPVDVGPSTARFSRKPPLPSSPLKIPAGNNQTNSQLRPSAVQPLPPVDGDSNR